MSISRTEVKTQLGLKTTSYDAQIDSLIPIAEAKYREIAGTDFNWPLYVDFTSGQTTFKPGRLNFGVPFGDAFIDVVPDQDSPIFQIKFGDIIEGTGIPAGTYVTSIDKINDQVTVSSAFTANGNTMSVTTNIEYYPVISSIIWYMIGRQSTTSQDEKEFSSKTVGPLSISLTTGQANTRFGIPQKIVDAIPKYAGVY